MASCLVCVCLPSLCSLPLLIPFALWLESESLFASTVWHDKHEALVAGGGVVAAGVLSFLLILFELAIVKHTSALSMDIIGYMKSIALILVSGLTFGDALSVVNVIGVVITFMGSLLYSFVKHKQAQRPHPSRVDNDRVAYEILSVLEMAQNWSDDDTLGEEDDALFLVPRSASSKREANRKPPQDPLQAVVMEEIDIDGNPDGNLTRRSPKS